MRCPWEPEFVAHVTSSMAVGSPGPAAYHIKRSMKKKDGGIKIKGRHTPKQQRVDAPFYNIPSTIGKGPGIKMHGRSEPKRRWEAPGPNYVPPSFGSEARKVGIAKPMKYDTRGGFKKRNPDETPGPGPAAAMLRDKSFDADGTRGVSIQGHHDFKHTPSISPGPGAYAPKYDSVLPAAPKVQVGVRPKEKPAKPSPGYRNTRPAAGAGPKWSIAPRANDEVRVV